MMIAMSFIINIVDTKLPCNLSLNFNGFIFFVTICCRFTMLLVACLPFLKFWKSANSRFVCLKVLQLVLRMSTKHSDCITTNRAKEKKPEICLQLVSLPAASSLKHWQRKMHFSHESSTCNVKKLQHFCR